MKLLTVVALALLATCAQAQSGNFPVFPFCKCQESPAAYSLASIVSKGSNTFCFNIRVTPPAGCTDYCCKADFKKLEINTNSFCDVPGLQLNASINGQRTAVNPNIEIAPQGNKNATILKLTNLGLNITNANNTQICITLNTNRAGAGCTTLEQLCAPSRGSLCHVAMFSTNNDCCPQDIIDVNPPIIVNECDTCVDFTLTSSSSVVPYNFTAAQCAAYASAVATNISLTAVTAGALLSRPFALSSCSGRSVKVCGAFKNSAEGKKLIPYGNTLAAGFLNLVTGSLIPYLSGHTVTVTIGGTVTSPTQPEVCLSGSAVINPLPGTVDYPKCICATNQGSTMWAPEPFYTTKPGRTGATTQYCFKFTTVTPVISPNNTCSNATTFQKVEFYANETLRRAVTGFVVTPKGGPSTDISSSWGAKGDNTLKATPLNWSIAQANGGEICLELAKRVSLTELCLGGIQNGCYINIFDVKLQCCPVYNVLDKPYTP